MPRSKILQILFLVCMFAASAVPVAAQSGPDTSTLTHRLYMPLTTNDKIVYESGWNEATLENREIVLSHERLDQKVSAAGTTQEGMTLVATLYIGGETLFVFCPPAGIIAIAGITVGTLVVVGMANAPSNRTILNVRQFNYIRKVRFSLPASEYLPEEIEAQKITVDWSATEAELLYLEGQELALVDAALASKMASTSIKAIVSVDGAQRFVVTYKWAAREWAVDELSPVLTTVGWRAMNVAIYKTKFSSNIPSLPGWVDTQTMATIDSDIPAFVRPGYTLVNSTDTFILADQGVLYGRWDNNGNPTFVDPVSVILVQGAPMMLYLMSDISEDSPEKPVQGWAALERRVQEIRSQPKQQINPPRDLRDDDDDESGGDDIPSLPERKYVECPAWSPQILTPSTKDVRRHPEDVYGAWHAYKWLKAGLSPKYGGTWTKDDPNKKTATLGYYSVYPPFEDPFLATGITRELWITRSDGSKVRIWAIQVWKFKNERNPNLGSQFAWYQASTYFRTETDSPYTVHLGKLWYNRPNNPPQFTGLCGYFKN
ncbi:hypothetical protein KAZ66_01195 [Candidatus Woesebacteria bacterium]|nr:hypothetical protein [Candidatus Woesebacteria bacterium]